jgi:alpha-L-rhamnosidase
MRTLCLCLLAVSTVASGSPVHLRTNSTENPIGIDTPQPSFSWRSDAVRPGWTQAGYEIRVASTAAALLKRGADVWDSGRVSSAESVNIPYAGPAIKPQTHYVWSVTTWDDRGRAEVSRPAWFETGLTTAEAWKGAWILRTDAQRDAQLATVRWIWLPGVDAMHVAPAAKAQFRYILRLPSQPVAASMHVVARGNFTARVNGHETGHHSNWGAFDREEIQPYLHAGDNEILLDAETDRARPPALDTPAALAVAIRIEDATGAEKLIVSGAAWQARRASTDAWVQAQDAGPLSKQFLLGTNRFGAAPGPTRLSTDASLFRKDFSVQQKIVSARLTMTALGAYVASINGQPVAPGTLLSPGWTDFTKRVLYQTYDVTPLLRHGRNAIGVELGGGWYSSPLTWAGFRSTPGPNLLRGQLDLTFADGSHQVIATDETWRTAPSPITFSEIYGGESYDGRLAQAGWNTAEFQDKQWAASQRSPVEPQATLTAQPDLLVQTHITIHPIKLDSANAQHPTVYDMGQNMVGNIRLHVQGPRGTLVKLRYAERLNADGSIYTENLRNADATDTYALTGEGEETWTPEFTFHGFRYVELSFPSSNTMPPPTLSTIEGLVYNSLPATPSVRLMSSSETLNKMNELGIWGQRGNFVSIPTDCPQRDERLGWMGDAGVFWRTGTYNFDIQSFTHKFMLDITDAQTAEGAFTDVSPNILGPNPGAPGWGDAGVSIPYAAWLQYGDSTVAARAWPSMERWMSFILENNPGYLRQHALGANYADWLAPDPNTPPDLIGTAYWAIDAHQMADRLRLPSGLCQRRRHRERRNADGLSGNHRDGDRAAEASLFDDGPPGKGHRSARQPSHHGLPGNAVPALRSG